MNRSREALLKELMELHFRLVDLNLFLDTHPMQTEAIQDFNQTSNKYNTMKNHFEKLYGPLMVDDHDDYEVPWPWIKGPWPWENMVAGGMNNVGV